MYLSEQVRDVYLEEKGVFRSKEVWVRPRDTIRGCTGMQRRHQYRNLPTEVVRALQTISETGSFTKAGEVLGLSQPAITAQIRRLSSLVGGQIFEKTPGGIALTGWGKTVLRLGRRMLEANDQILALAGGVGSEPPIRVGISNLLAEVFMASWALARPRLPVHISCDTSEEIARRIEEGFLDIACFFEPNPATECLQTWRESFVWVRGAGYMLRPDEPISLIAGHPGRFLNRLAINALERAGLRYSVAFTAPDLVARFAAVAAGLGLMPVPEWHLGAKVIRAEYRILPPLRPVEAAICVGDRFDRERAAPVLAIMRSLARPEPAGHPLSGAAGA
jgi:molybdate transport repressor ModE-like protein